MAILRLIIIIINSVVLATLNIILIPFNYKGKTTQLVYRLFGKLTLLSSGVKVNSIFKEELCKNKEYIFVSNHLSYLDIPVLMTVLPKNIRFIYKKSLSWIPIFGWSMYLGRYIPIDRKNAWSALDSLKKAAKRINQGLSIVIFPEGTRSKDGKTSDFKKGIFLLAEYANVEIVPVAINGTYEILNRYSLKIKPGVVTVSVGKPIKFEKRKDFLPEIREHIINMLK